MKKKTSKWLVFVLLMALIAGSVPGKAYASEAVPVATSADTEKDEESTKTNPDAKTDEAGKTDSDAKADEAGKTDADAKTDEAGKKDTDTKTDAADKTDANAKTDDAKKTVYKVYNLYVGGIHVTGENCDDILGDGTASYDPESNTLTLNNATIEIAKRNYGPDGYEYGIRANLTNGDDMEGGTSVLGAFTINLVGANTIKDDSTDDGTTKKYGICNVAQAALNITGSGTLDIPMKADDLTYTGIEVRNALNFSGPTVNIDIMGSRPARGIDVLYSNSVKLTGGAEVHITTGDNADTYAFYNDRNNKDLTVEEGSVFEALSGNKAFQQINITDETKPLGAFVNTEATSEGRSEWDGETDLNTYKYVRIPGMKHITVNYNLGAGHEELAKAEALKTAIEKYHGMKVLEVEGSVVKIDVPEEAPNGTKNTVARLLSTLLATLVEATGGNPRYDFKVYDQGKYFIHNALKTLENYSSLKEIIAERDDAEEKGTMPEDGQTIYALWAEPITEVSVDVESPVCGTEVTADLRDPEDPELGYDEETQKPQPVVSTDTEHVSVLVEDGWTSTWWVDPTDKEEDWFYVLPPCYVGTMEGGKDYMLVVNFKPDFGYYLPEDVTFTTTNGTVDDGLSKGIDMFGFAFITVTAEHEKAEPVEENRVEPTCTKKGSYDEVVYCKNHENCKKEFSRETKTIDALGHDWGEPTYTWNDSNTKVTATRVCKNDSSHVETETVTVSKTVTKEPTETKAGVRTLTATFTNPAFETQTKTESIPPTGEEEPDEVTYRNTSVTGNVWTKGSTTSSTFIFKRTVDDEKTYSLFRGIQVDGTDVAAANYDAESGSVIIKLKPAYLETLQVGQHTLKAIFEDGSATVTFRILQKSATVTPAAKKTTSNALTSKTTAAKTGDTNNIALYIIMLAVAVIALTVILIRRKRK